MDAPNPSLIAFKSISRLKPYRETIEVLQILHERQRLLNRPELKKCQILELPTEILQQIYSHLPRSSAAAFSLTCHSAAIIVGTKPWSDLDQDIRKAARCNLGRALERDTTNGVFCYNCEKIHRLVNLDPGRLRDHYTLCGLKKMSVRDQVTANVYLRVMMRRMGLVCNHILRMSEWEAYWEHLNRNRIVLNPLFSPQIPTQLFPPGMPFQIRTADFVARPVSIPEPIEPVRPLHLYQVSRVIQPQELPDPLFDSSLPLRIQTHTRVRSDETDASSFYRYRAKHHRGRRILASLKDFKRSTKPFQGNTWRKMERGSTSEMHGTEPEDYSSILGEFCALRNSPKLEDRTKDMRVMRDIMWFQERKLWLEMEGYDTDVWSSRGARMSSRGPPWFILTL